MYRKFVKRLLDLLFCVVLAVPAALIGLIVALFVKLSSPGPAVFRQDRVGKDSRIFTIYKFRTMRVERERDGVPLTDMQRMTRIGSIIRKLSLDELPQLLNILRGEMSFIGPRPLLVEYLPRYTAQQARRHEVLPGITGLAQVNGRNATAWETRLRLDVQYAETTTILLDIKILFLTVKAVLSRKGVNRSDGDTMPTFMGTDESDIDVN